MNNYNKLTINGVVQPIREYHGLRVVTFKDIDDVHKKPIGTAKRNFNSNKQYFIEGEDFFLINKNKVGTDFVLRYGFKDTAPSGTLITESGYLMIVKSLTGDLAWDVQRKLVNSYFRNNYFLKNSVTASTPLTREELAAYMIYNSQIIDSIKAENEFMLRSIKDSNQTLLKQQSDSLNYMIDLVKKFSEYESSQTKKYGSMMASGLYTLNNAIKTFTKVIECNNHDCSPATTLLNETIGDNEEEQWKKSAIKTVEKICSNLNIKGKNVVLLKIYATIKNSNGIDLNLEKEKYMKQRNIKVLSIISFISTSKKLRDLFDQYAKELLENSFCNDRKNTINSCQSVHIPFSQLVTITPSCIWDIVSPLYKIGYKKPSVMKFVYKEMENISDVSLVNISNTYAKQYQIKNICRGFVISQDEKLMKILKEAVNSIIKKYKESVINI